MVKKVFLLVGLMAFAVVGFSQQKDYPIQPVPFTKVHVTDNFWAPKMKINAEVTIPTTLQKSILHGRVDNFLKAAKPGTAEKLTQFTFDDTDIYKVIEGASYAMQNKPNPKLDSTIDSLITIIAAAQEPDGYLYTFRTAKVKKPSDWIGSKRWEKVEDLSHELYNSGHLFEAAVAHYQATGKKTLLNIAIKNADLLVKDFGYGKEEKFPGHEIVELGLARLYRVTGNKKYLDLAKFFLDIRGKKGSTQSEYNQSQKLVTDQHEAVGHAVRAAYLYTGMADVAALTGDKKYVTAIDDIWKDVVDHKLYITGGIGATGAGEAFGAAYELPNMSAYAETCASIGNVYWNERMFLLHGDSRYIDVLEKTLYNGLISGVSLSGDHFFYPNPLASMGQHQRSAWLNCACCISNMTRFMPSVPGYVYAKNNNDLYVNLYMSNSAAIDLSAGKVNIEQKTNYPWDGNVTIKVNPIKSGKFSILLRIPSWVENSAVPSNLYKFANATSDKVQVFINGNPIVNRLEKGYIVLDRLWKKGDSITFNLPMPVQKILANDKVEADKGRLALQRGPIVYCLEGPDNKDGKVQNIMIKTNAKVENEFDKNLLNGIEVLSTTGIASSRQANSDSLLITTQNVKAIPYYAWANRGPSDMTVWIPYEESAVRPSSIATIASKSKLNSSIGKTQALNAINDQFEPKNSADMSWPYFHWWPKKNSTEFVSYTFDSETTVSTSQVYWFDDTPFGGTRIPASYKILYLKDGNWIPVKNLTPYEVKKDQFDTINFDPIKTTALKLEVQLPVEFASGIHEWIVK